MARRHKNIGKPAQLPARSTRPTFKITAVAAAVSLALTGSAHADEWSAAVEAFIKHGNRRTIGGVDALLPLRQDGSSLFFADIKGQTASHNSNEFNLGLGYRQLTADSKWALGAYGAWDRRRSPLGNNFNQITLGAEARSDALDLRVNYYHPTTDKRLVGLGAANHFAGFTVFRNGVYEEAMRGADVEAGIPIPLPGVAETRLYLAGYTFKGDDVAPRTSGARVRAESRLTENLSVGVSVQHDNLFGTQSFLELRYAFGKAPAREPRKLRERMTDPWTRDIDIVVSKPTETAVQSASVMTADRAVHIDSARGSDATGDGSYESPYASTDYCWGSGKCAEDGTEEGVGDYNMIRLWQGNSLGTPYTAVTLLDGQTLWGQGADIYSGRTYPGLHPRIDGGEGVGIRLAQNATLGNAVAGVHVFNAGAGIYGLNTGGTVRIVGNVLEGNYGIHLRVDGGEGGTVTQNATILNNTITAAGDGVVLENYAKYGGTSTQNVTLTGNTITASSDGVRLRNTAKYGTASQTATLRGNTISASGTGVAIENRAEYGGDFVSGPGTATQTVTLTGNTIDGGEGVSIDNYADYGSSATQTATLTGNTITADGGEGVRIANYAYDYGTASQTATLSGNTIRGDWYGVYITNEAYGEGTATQTVTLSDNTISAAWGTGVYIYNEADGESWDTARQTVTLTGNTIDGGEGGEGGVRVGNYAGYSSRAIQTVTLDSNTISGGVSLYNRAGYDATATQTATLSGNTVTATDGVGVYVVNRADYDGSAAQTVTLQNNAITGGDIAAYVVHYNGESVEGTTQTVTLTGNTLTATDYGAAKCANGPGQTVTVGSGNTHNGATTTTATDVCGGGPE